MTFVTETITKVIDYINEINRRDYVLTFRSYVPVDGEKHNFKLMLNYENLADFDDNYFEAMSIPMHVLPYSDQMKKVKRALMDNITYLEEKNPYVEEKVK